MHTRDSLNLKIWEKTFNLVQEARSHALSLGGLHSSADDNQVKLRLETHQHGNEVRTNWVFNSPCERGGHESHGHHYEVSQSNKRREFEPKHEHLQQHGRNVFHPKETKHGEGHEIFDADLEVEARDNKLSYDNLLVNDAHREANVGDPMEILDAKSGEELALCYIKQFAHILQERLASLEFVKELLQNAFDEE